MIVQKIFDKDGDFKILFAHDSKQQIKDWLSENDTSEEEGMKYAVKVNDDVFGESLVFPCRLQ